MAVNVGSDLFEGLGHGEPLYLAQGALGGCLVTATSDWSCAAPLAILFVGRNYGNFYKQMLWLMAITTLYSIAFFIINNHIYGIVHLATWLTVPLLSLLMVNVEKQNGSENSSTGIIRFIWP